MAKKMVSKKKKKEVSEEETSNDEETFEGEGNTSKKTEKVAMTHKLGSSNTPGKKISKSDRDKKGKKKKNGDPLPVGSAMTEAYVAEVKPIEELLEEEDEDTDAPVRRLDDVVGELRDGALGGVNYTEKSEGVSYAGSNDGVSYSGSSTGGGSETYVGGDRRVYDATRQGKTEEQKYMGRQNEEVRAARDQSRDVYTTSGSNVYTPSGGGSGVYDPNAPTTKPGEQISADPMSDIIKRQRNIGNYDSGTSNI